MVKAIMMLASAAAAFALCSPAMAYGPADQYTSCTMAIYDNPAMAPIRANTPLTIDVVSLAQLSNQNFATDYEISLILWAHPQLQACRQAYLAQIPSRFVPIIEGFIATFDGNLVLLVQKKVAWGSFLQNWQAANAEMTTAVANMNQQAVAEWQSAWANFSNVLSNLAAQSQARTNALNSMVQQQAASMPRPVYCAGSRGINPSFYCY